ncbi:MAG TPA: cobalamin-independent methionine synthase II family protein [Bryobacteraceae bacterium]|nr:cobalamin-independent methionine synthase II family protein [Bryobacteraceae bacterium]
MPDNAVRILTTHCGSLPRPKPLLDLMKEKLQGRQYDAGEYDAEVRSAVVQCVRQQAECGIDIPTDGEQGKAGFYAYVTERLGGFEARPGRRQGVFAAELEAFPEYYEDYFSRAMLGATLAPVSSVICTGPVSYRGQEAVRRDIDNLKAALNGWNPADAFLPAVAPSGVGKNEFYPTEQEFLYAVAEAMRHEYLAIIQANFQLQIDDPFLTELYSYSKLTPAERRKMGEMYVEALNYGLRGIPAERVRYHTCYGINEGPRVYDAPLRDLIDLVLKVNAGAYSFEAANPRHEHEYRIWETVKLPEGKSIIPGVISHANNIVEHPEWIAERLVRYARLVGRENVIAGADCGFSSQATYRPEVHPTVIWSKFKAMAEGARLASEQLWRG